jgi:predicted component of type VI protein secretion system
VQEARLVSGSHAHILYQDGAYALFDGTPGGKRSVNGTFVNGHQVGPGGRRLEDGDIILLASLDPKRPRLDTPGVAALAFHTSTREQG